jgi:hypothetical protein
MEPGTDHRAHALPIWKIWLAPIPQQNVEIALFRWGILGKPTGQQSRDNGMYPAQSKSEK